MDANTALILEDAIDDALEAAEGLSQAQLKELVRRKLAEQRVAPELLAAWRLIDEGGAR
jgi:hypothetical protein